MKHPHIYVAYTGGTIGMEATRDGLRSGADLEGWLKSLIAESRFSHCEWEVNVYDPLIDSSNASTSNWQTIIDDVREHSHLADAILVLHGTDTMAYTSSALAFALSGIDIPVIITGAQLPFHDQRSDAALNVTGALACALDPRLRGVALFFGNHLLHAARAQKVSSDGFVGFDSPNYPELAWVTTEGRVVVHVPQRDPVIEAPFMTKPTGFSQDPRQEVAVVYITPGMSEERIKSALDPAPAGVILMGYGTGNAPDLSPDIPSLARYLRDQGSIVVMVSQCRKGEVDLATYATGSALLRAGVCGAGDMTLEAAYAKLRFLLAQGLSAHQVVSLMEENLVGEKTAVTSEAKGEQIWV